MNPETTPFLPTEIDFPVDETNPNAVKNFLIDNLKKIIDALNQKDVAIYFPVESFNGQSWFQPGSTSKQRNGFRKVVDFGSLPLSGPKSVKHGIDVDKDFTITHLWGAANDHQNFSYLPIPYAETGNNVSLIMDDTEVTITTETNMTAYTETYVVIEYVKSR